MSFGQRTCLVVVISLLIGLLAQLSYWSYDSSNNMKNSESVKIEKNKAALIQISKNIITFNNVTYPDLLFIKRQTQAQGIFLKTIDNQTDVWNTPGITFYSKPFQNERQEWFNSTTHNHNKAALYDKWYESLPLSKIPFLSKYFIGHDGNQNVNRTNIIQREYGIEWICINATQNEDARTFRIKAINKYEYLFKLDWIILLELQFLFCWMIAYYYYLFAIWGSYDYIKFLKTKYVQSSSKKHCYATKRYVTASISLVQTAYKHWKNILYLIYYPHSDWFSVSLMAIATLQQFNLEYQVCSGSFKLLKKMIFASDLEGRALKDQKRKNAWELNLMYIFAMLYDSNKLGYNFNYYQFLTTFIASYSIAIGMANSVAEAKQEELYNKTEKRPAIDKFKTALITNWFYIITYLILLKKFFQPSQPSLLREGFIKATFYQKPLPYYFWFVQLAILYLLIFTIRQRIKLRKGYFKRQRPMELEALGDFIRKLKNQDVESIYLDYKKKDEEHFSDKHEESKEMKSKKFSGIEKRNFIILKLLPFQELFLWKNMKEEEENLTEREKRHIQHSLDKEIEYLNDDTVLPFKELQELRQIKQKLKQDDLTENEKKDLNKEKTQKLSIIEKRQIELHIELKKLKGVKFLRKSITKMLKKRKSQENIQQSLEMPLLVNDNNP